MASTTITKFADLKIRLEDVVKATNNFHRDNIIGHGGLGRAYKGLLHQSGELIKISALRLDRAKHGEAALEFWTEISRLSDLKHTNLVSMIGFCDEESEKIIVTRYTARGSLVQYLNNPNLTWTQRLKICVGVARALSYLHYDEGRGYGVIHLNTNSSTVLLDENWEPKLSGFKVSIKQLSNRMDQVVLSEPIGAIGYTDPVIEKTKGVTHKSDVYSFGVVLLEVMCGRRAFDPNDDNKLLAPFATHHYENQTVQNIIHPDLRNQMSMRSLLKYSKVAYSCLEDERTHRPDMLYIVAKLEKLLELQLRREKIVNNLEYLKIPLTRIQSATDDFSDRYKIAILTHVQLYRAELDHYDRENDSSKRRSTVLIKRYPFGNLFREEKQFFTEIEVLGNAIKHPNIVTLLGFCVEAYEMILVTDYFSNGFLYDYLGKGNENHFFTWEKRLKISIDVAQALKYIHYEMEDHKIINRDICSYNIGLDENWRAKIVYFGDSVFLPPNQEDKALNLNWRGRRCCIDPEYEKTNKLKRESDVYSFGVMLLEILCGKSADDQIYLKESDRGLADVARRSYNKRTLEDMIDPIIKEETYEFNFVLERGPNKESLLTFIEIAHQCVAETQDRRPTMKVVVKQLMKALFFQQHNNEDPLGNLQKLGMSLEDKNQETQNFHDDNCNEFQEEELQCSYVDKDRLEKASELHSVHEVMVNNLERLKIPLTRIQSATNHFSQRYSINSFSHGLIYYRAEIEHYDKENPTSKRQLTVIIKRYPPEQDAYGADEFFREIEILTSVKHPNIVKLLGFCFEASEMILVIQNLSNGFLGDYMNNIKDKHFLTWEKRLNISIDVAKAIRYIHFEMEDQKMIINRDICNYNIALDENWEAKIVDFWWSVHLPPNQANEALHLNVVGRPFYVDPQYVKSFKLKRESDVYSFGVVLLEILCGRLSDDPIYLKENKKGLPHVARRSFRMGTLEEMIDPTIKGETSENNFVLNRGPIKDSLNTFIDIAQKCIAKTQDQRPTMKVVVNELEKALYYQKNKKDNLRMPLEDIKRATQNFHNDNYIGGGGFGKVYKGIFQDGDDFKTIVAKRLYTSSGQEEQQFLNELQILLDYKHENVIGLVGYCDENDEKIIICEYASRGSLDRYLDDASLTWVKRLNICINVASALNFLHGGVGKQAKVIHRDIKTNNILLNDDWKAQLGDFGLSLISTLIRETDYVIDHACGTKGYVDPLYIESKFLTIESDIYSFGVVLFELLCGKSTHTIHKHEGCHIDELVKSRFEKGKHDEVVFEQIRNQIEPKSLTTFQTIAFKCLHHEREKRPTTKEILIQLKKALAYQNMASTMAKFAPLQIPFEDLVMATNTFDDDNIIQHSGFGTTYKGQLPRPGKKMTIAAQRFDCKHQEGDLEFLNEISVLSDLNHTNLGSIVGFCDEEGEKIIVTTYEAKGSLGQYLNSPSLTWKQRLRICVGVARALNYLHYDKGRDYAIIHCNINSDTILLDGNWEAKLSNFASSVKQALNHKDHVCLGEHTGNTGYLDPAITKTGGVTQKSDIYSFGVVLFEILCGRKAGENEDNRFLAALAKYHYKNETLKDIIQPYLWNQMSMRSLLKYSKVAYSCLKDERARRPDMLYIVAKLEKLLELQLRREKILDLDRSFAPSPAAQITPISPLI